MTQYAESRRSIHRTTWEKLERKCIGQVHGEIWMRVSCPEARGVFSWHEIMDRVDSRAWGIFSSLPVSASHL